MKITTELEKLNSFEQKINFNIDLLEVTKCFCDMNYDKAPEITTISTILDVLLTTQKELATDFDILLSQKN